MKFLHLGDLHLGKSLNNFDLIEDQRYILNEILDIINVQAVDAVLIAGDVYDKAIPSEAATKLLDEFLNELVHANVKTFIISGNHDSDDRLNFGSSLFEANNIFISAIFDGTLCKKTLTDEYGKVNIYLLPFVKASQVRHFYDDEITSYNDAVRTIIEHTDISTDERNIIVAHQFVAGKSDAPKLAGSEGMATQTVGTIETIGYDLFDKFDYAALGHIHSPQKVGRNEVRYSGSPLKYSLSEVTNEKSVPIITFAEKGNIKIELLPLKPLRDLRHIKGEMKQLLKPENVSATDDFIYATLTDEDIINDAMLIFQQTYPNTVKIEYENSHTKSVEQVDISKIIEERDFKELVSDFYTEVYGCEISPEELQVMEDIAKEVGLNEAN